MKTLSRILILLAFMPSIVYGFDHKTCVLDHMRNYLNAQNSCQQENLKASLDQVQSAYADCDRDMVISSNEVSLDELKKISAADYDHELRGLIVDKISSCGFKGSVRIRSKGLVGSVDIAKSAGEKKAVVASEAHSDAP